MISGKIFFWNHEKNLLNWRLIFKASILWITVKYIKVNQNKPSEITIKRATVSENKYNTNRD